jgi:hypothetical protein
MHGFGEPLGLLVDIDALYVFIKYVREYGFLKDKIDIASHPLVGECISLLSFSIGHA